MIAAGYITLLAGSKITLKISVLRVPSFTGASIEVITVTVAIILTQITRGSQKNIGAVAFCLLLLQDA